MDVLNKQFMSDPLGFMKKYVIETDGKIDKGNGAGAGKANFDMEYHSKNPLIVVLSFYTKPIDGKASPISAWWLPWKTGATVNMTLKAGADYFFTSSLGGCRIQFSGGSEPVVSHIAGDTGGDAGGGAGGAKWRDDQSAANAGAHHGMVRTVSSTDLTSPSMYSNEGLANFAAYKKNGSWKFITQAIDFDDKTGQCKVLKADESVG